jgi:hypothetical protein
MATVCELNAGFEDALHTLHGMFIDNIEAAAHWGTRWDVVRDETITTADGETVRLVWGFTTAYARIDGMGGHVSYLMKFIEYDHTTEINVVVTSPYERNTRKSAYFRRNHKVALRLLEFCVAPYEEIHPRVGAFKRMFTSLLSRPAQRTT